MPIVQDRLLTLIETAEIWEQWFWERKYLLAKPIEQQLTLLNSVISHTPDPVHRQLFEEVKTSLLIALQSFEHRPISEELMINLAVEKKHFAKVKQRNKIAKGYQARIRAERKGQTQISSKPLDLENDPHYLARQKKAQETWYEGPNAPPKPQEPAQEPEPKPQVEHSYGGIVPEHVKQLYDQAKPQPQAQAQAQPSDYDPTQREWKTLSDGTRVEAHPPSLGRVTRVRYGGMRNQGDGVRSTNSRRTWANSSRWPPNGNRAIASSNSSQANWRCSSFRTTAASSATIATNAGTSCTSLWSAS